MKVIKPPSNVKVSRETCNICGAVLELNFWDYKEKTSEEQDPFGSWHTVKRNWYHCPCCHSTNVVKTVVDGKRKIKENDC